MGTDRGPLICIIGTDHFLPVADFVLAIHLALWQYLVTIICSGLIFGPQELLILASVPLPCSSLPEADP